MSETILEVIRLPDSCKKVFSIIIEEGPLSSKEIVTRVSCSTRSVRYALKRLLENEFVERCPNLSDMRQTLYYARVDKLKAEATILKKVQ